jgi:hypothetical protein
MFNVLPPVSLFYTHWFINVKIQKKLSYSICIVLCVVVILVQDDDDDDTEGGCY